MVSCTVNSYSRLIPGFWAPTNATWGVENRTCALRVIPGSEKSQRVEYRIAAADMNPYLAMAVAIGSGLYGIENKIEPMPAIVGNSYDQKHPAKLDLPRTLWEAAQRLKKSKAAADLFGEPFVEHWAATREWEEREFRKHITDWELAALFRDHLTDSSIMAAVQKTITPIDNSVYVERPYASAAEIAATLEGARPKRSAPGSSRRSPSARRS